MSTIWSSASKRHEKTSPPRWRETLSTTPTGTASITETRCSSNSMNSATARLRFVSLLSAQACPNRMEPFMSVPAAAHSVSISRKTLSTKDLKSADSLSGVPAALRKADASSLRPASISGATASLTRASAIIAPRTGICSTSARPRLPRTEVLITTR